MKGSLGFKVEATKNNVFFYTLYIYYVMICKIYIATYKWCILYIMYICVACIIGQNL
jgi:hypothetical protein